VAFKNQFAVILKTMDNSKNTFAKILRPILWVLVALFLGLAIFQVYNRARLSINESPLQRHKQGSFANLQILPKPPSILGQKFVTSTGKEITISDISGKIKIVNIWAIWCPPCVREMPELAEFARKHKSSGLVVIPISIDKPEQVKKAQAKLFELAGNELEFYSDPSMNLPFPLLVEGFPTTIIYNEQNQEIARIANAPKWNSSEADSLAKTIFELK
jgi:thiol-disulfide isomerase/thioredoxin